MEIEQYDPNINMSTIIEISKWMKPKKESIRKWKNKKENSE